MNILIVFLSIISSISAGALDRVVGHISDLILYQHEEMIEFQNDNIGYLSNFLKDPLAAIKLLQYYHGKKGKIFVPPEQQQFILFDTKTPELEIDINKSYQTMWLVIDGGFLTTLPRHLHRLTNLTVLSLTNNQIESVDENELNGLINLKHLCLRRNRLKEFDATGDISLPKLKYVHFEHNELTKFKISEWKLPELFRIGLSENKLSHIVHNPSASPKLGEVVLSRNDVDCTWLCEFRAKYMDIIINADTYCDQFLSQSSHDCEETKCGQRQTKIVELIVEGQDADRGMWPWHAAVYRSMEYACGGTLINRRFVLTAAHCVVWEESRKAIPSNMLQVKLGMHILDRVDSKTQEFNVEKLYIYDNYTQHVDDVSLLKLSTEASFDAFVQPVCIDYSGDLVGQYGTVIGWGFRSDNKLATKLQSAQMPVHRMVDCLASSRNFYGHALYDGVMCGGYLNGTSVCNGDSGGGFVFQRKNRWYIGGIVSFSESRHERDHRCKMDGYGGFTNVSHYGQWIISTVQN